MTSLISVPARKLRLMLTAVLPHVGTDDTLPWICGVNFEMTAGTLYLAGTDRYTLGVAREPVPGAIAAGIPDQAAILPVAAARELRALLKKRDGVAAIVIGDGKLTVDAVGVSGSWETIAGGTFGKNSPRFPDWRGLLHRPLTGTQEPLGDKSGVDPAKLARLSVGPDRTLDSLSIRFLLRPEDKSQANPVPMVLATAGDWFLGAVMPMRHADDPGADAAAQWDDWAAVCAPAEKAETPAEAVTAEPEKVSADA